MTQNKGNQGGKPDNDKQIDIEAERKRIEQEVREQLQAELAAEREQLAKERESYNREAEMLKQQQNEVEATLKARPDIERPAGSLISDLNLTAEEKKGLSPDATAAEKRALSLRLRKAKKLSGKSVLRKFKVTINSKTGSNVVIKYAVDESEAISQAYREMGIEPINGQHTATRVD